MLVFSARKRHAPTINERDEPPRLVPLAQPHPRNILHEDRPELPGDLEIVRRAERLVAQVGKGEAGDTA